MATIQQSIGFPNGDDRNAAGRVTVNGSTWALRPEAAGALAAWNAAHRERWGRDIPVNETQRSLATQQAYWDAYQAGTGNLAAYPGSSNHGWGIALDFDIWSDEHWKWNDDNAPRFGWWNAGYWFSQRERWHWEFSGENLTDAQVAAYAAAGGGAMSAQDIITQGRSIGGVQVGFENADAIVRAAATAGLPLGIAVALVEKESTWPKAEGGGSVAGRQIYGHDSGAVFSTAALGRPSDGRVTEANFADFRARVSAGGVSNGVGITQITYPGHFPAADEQGLRLWDAHDNGVYGFRLLAGYLGGDYSAASVKRAGSYYNSGSWTAVVESYGADLASRVDYWTSALAGASTDGGFLVALSDDQQLDLLKRVQNIDYLLYASTNEAAKTAASGVPAINDVQQRQVPLVVQRLAAIEQRLDAEAAERGRILEFLASIESQQSGLTAEQVAEVAQQIAASLTGGVAVTVDAAAVAAAVRAELGRALA